MIAHDLDAETAAFDGCAPSVGWTWGAILLDVVLWALLLAFGLSGCAAAPTAPAAPAVGVRCTYTEDNGRQWAATLHAIAPGAGGIPWAWLTIDADPRRMVKLPASELRGCL